MHALRSCVAAAAVTFAAASLSPAAVILEDDFNDGNVNGWAKAEGARSNSVAYVSDYGVAGNNTGALASNYSSNPSVTGTIKHSLSGGAIDHNDPTANTIRLTFDFRYMGKQSGGQTSSSSFRFSLGTNTEGHAFQFSNAATASNGGFTIYANQDNLSGSPNPGGSGSIAPAITINDTTSSHTFSLSITRTGETTADYTATVDDNTWTWSSSLGITNWNFDRIVVGTGTNTQMSLRYDNFKVEVIPEPASLGLVGLAGTLLLGGRRQTAGRRHAPKSR